MSGFLTWLSCDFDVITYILISRIGQVTQTQMFDQGKTILLCFRFQ